MIAPTHFAAGPADASPTTWSAVGASGARVQRRLWILLLCALLNSGLWMGALHHHDDFSRDNADCIFCQAAGSPAVYHTCCPAPQVFHRLPERLPIRFELHALNSSRILFHSPKTGPPSPSFPA